MELKNKEYYLIATEFDGIESDYIKFTQNDTNNSVLNISVPYPSDQLLLCVTKPDGDDVVDRFVASDETNTNFNMELPINLINLPGTYKATVQAYGHDDDRRTVGTFKYRIASDFNTDFIESNENYPVLTKLISDVNSLYDKVVDIDHGEGGRILAEEQRVQAEIVRKGNEVIRENQEIAREERLKEVESSLESMESQSIKLIDNIDTFKIGQIISSDYIRKQQIKLLSQQMKKIKKYQPTTLDCRGDSMTYGTDLKSSDSFNEIPNLPRAIKNYPEYLQDYLNKVYPDTITVSKTAFPGDTVKLGYDRWKDSVAKDITIIMYGINDFSDNNIDDFIHYYEQMIARLTLQGSAIIMLNTSKGKNTSIFEENNYINFAIKKIGEKFGIPVIDSFKFMYNYSYDIYSDSVHFNKKGYSIFASRIASYFVGMSLFKTKEVMNGTELLVRVKEDNCTTTPYGSVHNSWENATSPFPNEFTNLGGLPYIGKGASVFYSFETKEDNLIVYPTARLVNPYEVIFELDFGVAQSCVTNKNTFNDLDSELLTLKSTLSIIPTKNIDINKEYYINNKNTGILIPKAGIHTVEFKNVTAVNYFGGIGFIGYDTLKSEILTKNQGKIIQNFYNGYTESPANITTTEISFEQLKLLTGFNKIYSIEYNDIIDIPLNLTLYTLSESVISYMFLLGATNGSSRVFKESGRVNIKSTPSNERTCVSVVPDFANKKIVITWGGALNAFGSFTISVM